MVLLNHWQQHKSPCKEIQKAQSGDIECMRALVSAYTEAALRTKKKKYAQNYSNVLNLYYIYYVHVLTKWFGFEQLQGNVINEAG